jgi:hypothetical protein
MKEELVNVEFKLGKLWALGGDTTTRRPSAGGDSGRVEDSWGCARTLPTRMQALSV